MTVFTFARSDVKVMLWHLALYGLAAILDEACTPDLRVSWTSGMEPRAQLHSPDLTDDLIAGTVHQHALDHATAPSWILEDITLKGSLRGLMSPRITPLDQNDRSRVQHARHQQLDILTTDHAWLDLRMLAALGEPCYWSLNRKGDVLQDDGASRLEMQPRNQGSEIVGSRLRKLAETVAARTPDAIHDGLSGATIHDEAGNDSLSSRTATGFTNPGPTDNAIAWCALWGISQLPIAPRIDKTAVTSGHIGRTRREWFYFPVWSHPRRTAWLRTMLTSQHLRTAATTGLPEPWSEPDTRQIQARSWLNAHGIPGLMRFPIERFGSDSAPERRAMIGIATRTNLT